MTETWRTEQIAILNSQPNGTHVAVIAMRGTYSPVTTGHIANFHQAHKHLASQHFEAILGMMSLNTSSSVEEKFTNMGQSCLPYAERKRLIDLAIAGIPWLSSFSNEDTSSEHFNAGIIVELLSAQWPRLVFVGFTMNRADDVLKYSKWKTHRGHMLVIGRGEYTERVRDGMGQRYPNISIIEGLSDGISSTAVREASDVSDMETLNSMLHPHVAYEFIANAKKITQSRARSPIMQGVSMACQKNGHDSGMWYHPWTDKAYCTYTKLDDAATYYTALPEISTPHGVNKIQRGEMATETSHVIATCNGGALLNVKHVLDMVIPNNIPISLCDPPTMQIEDLMCDSGQSGGDIGRGAEFSRRTQEGKAELYSDASSNEVIDAGSHRLVACTLGGPEYDSHLNYGSKVKPNNDSTSHGTFQELVGRPSRNRGVSREWIIPFLKEQG